MKRFIPLIIMLIAIISLAYYVKLPQQTELRPLGKFYLENSYFGNYSAKSPEVVTSILWDYRGVDTLFETSVFFLAIIGSLALFSLERRERKRKSQGLTLIVRDVTKVIVAMIITVSASIALHGHLTPGGGFQGGSALAVAPLLIIAAYSKYVLEEHGLDKTRALVLRSIGLLGITLVALIPLLEGGFIMQNQPIFPAEIGGQLLSGSLIYYNIFEFLAVGAGFTAVFLLLSIPEKEVRA
ncbi:MnhB domain-containing protein [Pyrococcus abyssi]|uniref:Multisubunit Na+/H+ antiporter,putative MnhB subunit n=1 Tax=Pyrococcus abyssi (strain GE5 / Orsay) TaxID=272844 RepID=Q9UYN8_PYRAB|nr:MnhB domain-containing protein [Pyrococcus abyssi]CAB50374.1 Multisubunit Na+/H+ antiporter,putative MnhB subunit [Pyrococcus abyssi GE5]CCE70918.1 TPA: Na+/H+ antiporter MnhB subunit-related protein [Pyrococcus abyssi GE5]